MPIESATYVSQLVATNPAGTDDRSTLDNHDRLVKQALVNTFLDFRIPVSASAGEVNFLIGTTANLQTQLNSLYNRSISSSAELQTYISALSSTLNTKINTDVAAANAGVRSTSAVIQAVIVSEISATNAGVRSTSAALQAIITSEISAVNAGVRSTSAALQALINAKASSPVALNNIEAAVSGNFAELHAYLYRTTGGIASKQVAWEGIIGRSGAYTCVIYVSEVIGNNTIQIYKDNTTLGTERVSVVSSTTYAETLVFSAGSRIQLYESSGASGNSSTVNFFVCSGNPVNACENYLFKRPYWGKITDETGSSGGATVFIVNGITKP